MKTKYAEGTARTKGFTIKLSEEDYKFIIEALGEKKLGGKIRDIVIREIKKNEDF